MSEKPRPIGDLFDAILDLLARSEDSGQQRQDREQDQPTAKQAS